MFRETPCLTQTPDLCPALLSGSPSRFSLQQCCVRRRSSRAGADSQHSGHSQVRSAWPGEGETVSRERNAVKSSSFSGKQLCPLPAGVTSSAGHAFPSLFSPLLSSALHLEVASQVRSRWLSQRGDGNVERTMGRLEEAGWGKQTSFCRAECSSESVCGNRGQERLSWATAASVIPKR